MNRAFSADALGGDECLGRLPQAGAECRAFGAKYVLENAMFHAQQTGSAHGARGAQQDLKLTLQRFRKSPKRHRVSFAFRLNQRNQARSDRQWALIQKSSCPRLQTPARAGALALVPARSC